MNEPLLLVRERDVSGDLRYYERLERSVRTTIVLVYLTCLKT